MFLRQIELQVNERTNLNETRATLVIACMPVVICLMKRCAQLSM